MEYVGEAGEAGVEGAGDGGEAGGGADGEAEEVPVLELPEGGPLLHQVRQDVVRGQVQELVEVARAVLQMDGKVRQAAKYGEY